MSLVTVYRLSQAPLSRLLIKQTPGAADLVSAWDDQTAWFGLSRRHCTALYIFCTTEYCEQKTLLQLQSREVHCYTPCMPLHPLDLWHCNGTAAYSRRKLQHSPTDRSCSAARTGCGGRLGKAPTQIILRQSVY